jgi:hypothetical protein
MKSTSSTVDSTLPELTDQPDGPGKRLGEKSELTIINDLTPDGARLFKDRLVELQRDAGIYEPMVGTVDNFRAILIDNESRLLVTIVYDGDFEPYVTDIINNAAPWLDRIFTDVAVGFPGSHSPDAPRWVIDSCYTASIFFHPHPDKTVRDVAKMKRVSSALDELLDAAS